MATAWIDRDGREHPAVFTPPTVTAGSLVELAERLG
jgi:hypothetical protein